MTTLSKAAEERQKEVGYTGPKARWNCSTCANCEVRLYGKRPEKMLHCNPHQFVVATFGLCPDYKVEPRRL